MVTYEQPTHLKIVEKDLDILQSDFDKGMRQGLSIAEIIKAYNDRYTVHTPGPTTVTLFLALKGYISFYNQNTSNIQAMIDGEMVEIPWTVRRSPDPKPQR